MTGLTPEQRQLIEQAGDEPVPIEDPELHETVYLVRKGVLERLGQPLAAKPSHGIEIPEGIRRSQEAFFRDLPGLLNDRKLRGRYVAYHGQEQVGIAEDDEPLIRECQRRGLKRDEYDILVIEPQTPEPEEIDYPSAWYGA